MTHEQMKGLQQFLIGHVRPMYFSFDRAHDEYHFDEVFETTIKLSHLYKLSDLKYVALLTAAAYHDTGRLIDDAKHDFYSIKIYKKDLYLKSFINEVFPKLSYDKVIKLGSKIIRYHRSAKTTKNELCLILKDADKISHFYKERGLYRPIAFYIDRVWDGENIYSILLNRKEYFDGYIKYTPKSKAMKYLIGDNTRIIQISDTDIENMVYKILGKEIKL